MDYNEAEMILSAVTERLQRERKRRGLSLKKLGKISGVSRVEIGLIETGKRNPSVIICLRVADALGLNLGNVLKTAMAQVRKDKG